MMEAGRSVICQFADDPRPTLWQERILLSRVTKRRWITLMPDCELNEVAYNCLSCGFQCDECAADHCTKKSLRNHNIVSIDEYHRERSSPADADVQVRLPADTNDGDLVTHPPVSGWRTGVANLQPTT